MRVLIVGSGAREHAIAWKLSRERSVTDLFCAPGNPGMAEIARCLQVDPGNAEALLALAREHAIDLTVVGPELPLSRGVVDRFEDQGGRVGRDLLRIYCTILVEQESQKPIVIGRHGEMLKRIGTAE